MDEQLLPDGTTLSQSMGFQHLGRGRRHEAGRRRPMLELLDEAVLAGARLAKACQVVKLSVRTVERWRAEDGGHDRRAGPLSAPPHKLDDIERAAILDVSNSEEFRDKRPRQIVPTLADRGEYIASESTFYRVLHEEGLMQHLQRARPRASHKPKEHVAPAPNRVWCWDITYLRSSMDQSSCPFGYLASSSLRAASLGCQRIVMLGPRRSIH